MSTAGFIYGKAMHHLDHIAPLCIILDLPLIVTEKEVNDTAKKYYPSLVIFLIDEIQLADYIAKHYSIILSCLPTVMLSKLLFSVHHLYHKQLLTIWCPHGHSDKGSHGSYESVKSERYALVYGQKMRDFFHSQNVFHNLIDTIAIGNYRYRYHCNVKRFYMDLFEAKIASQFPEQKEFILYAPTWSDGIEPTTFFDACPTLINELPPQYNLIVKIHPNLKIQHLAEVEKMMVQYDHHPSVLFLCSFPLIYPILENTRLYIGDRSSIGYDFFNLQSTYVFHWS